VIESELGIMVSLSSSQGNYALQANNFPPLRNYGSEPNKMEGLSCIAANHLFYFNPISRFVLKLHFYSKPAE